jgi:ABC-type antimicrobial peptide transport system permease subunit
MRFVGIGVLVGLIGVFGCSRLLQSLLFGIGATDLSTTFIATLTLAAVAFCACYIPARRAMRVDPMEALRSE